MRDVAEKIVAKYMLEGGVRSDEPASIYILNVHRRSDGVQIDGLAKIGITTLPIKRRISDIQKSANYGIYLYSRFNSYDLDENAPEIEAKIKKKLNKKGLLDSEDRSEIFKISPEKLDDMVYEQIFRANPMGFD